MLLPDGLAGCLGGEGEQPCKSRHLLLRGMYVICRMMLVKSVIKKEEENKTK